MTTEVRDTSQDYDDMISYKAKENIRTDLSVFFGEETDQRPIVPPKKIDPDFPEQWQSLFVNFRSHEDFVKFMKLIDEVPSPKTKDLVFKANKDNGILNFFGD